MKYRHKEYTTPAVPPKEPPSTCEHGRRSGLCPWCNGQPIPKICEVHQFAYLIACQKCAAEAEKGKCAHGTDWGMDCPECQDAPPGLRKVSERPLSTLPGTITEYEMIPANSEIARVEAILYRLVPGVLTNRPSRARLAKRAAVQAAAREIVTGAYSAPMPRVIELEVKSLEPVGPEFQQFVKVELQKGMVFYDPDTYGDDGEGGISGDGLADIGIP